MLTWLLILSCSSTPLPRLSDVVVEFKKIHTHIYGVYDLGLEPERIHNLLSLSFLGEALTAEYIEHFTTLHHMGIEETSIDIRTVDYNSITAVHFTLGEVCLDVDWSVGGVVTHRSHKHTRVNRYRAFYTLKAVEQNWRITDTKMRSVERIRRASDEDILNGQDASGGYLDPLDLLDAGMMEQIQEEANVGD